MNMFTSGAGMRETLPERTAKGQRTRVHILDTALRLFAGYGYEKTTMREIAATAGCSPGLAYRYFAGKEDIVLSLYTRLEVEFAATVAALPAGPLADRFQAAMRAKLQQIAPYRDALAALFGAALNPRSGVAVLGESTGAIREHARAAFVDLVVGASDAPPDPLAGQLATVLYGLHLALLFLSLAERRPDGQTSEELTGLTAEALGLVGPLLAWPGAESALARLSGALGPALGVETPATGEW
jgi:AcrR family transcriptional regulator